MSTHTPGPWIAVPRADLAENGNVIVESSNETICHVFDDNNAPLIAKAPIAPKLAEALRGFIRHEVCITGPARAYLHEAGAALAEWDAQS